MRIKVQVDAKRDPNDRNVFLGTIYVKIVDESFTGTFDFQMEKFDGGGGDMNIWKIKQAGKPVFTPETLAGSRGTLQKICRETVELAVDLMEDIGSMSSTYTGDFPVDDVDAGGVKKFLRDNSGDPIN